LDESSSDDDDELILSAAEIVGSHSQPTRKYGDSIPGHIVMYRDREGRRALENVSRLFSE
jgi:hypothetical protein